MASRTTETVVSFSAPFLLPGFDGPEPAGEYRIQHDEESIDGPSWRAWHRTASYIFLPAIGANASKLQMAPVNLEDLDEALVKDHSK